MKKKEVEENEILEITLEEVGENKKIFNSKTIYIVEQVIQGREMHSSLEEYIFANDELMFELFFRTPHDTFKLELFKKNIFIRLLKKGSVTPNHLRTITESLNRSSALLLQILSEYRKHGKKKK